MVRRISLSRSMDHLFSLSSFSSFLPSLFLSLRVRFSRERVFPRYFPCASTSCRATCAFRFTFREPRPLPDLRRPLTPKELLSFFLLLSLSPSSRFLRNSDSFQGNVYPRRKMRLKCIGACFPRRARAISTRILWVYYMTAPYLGIHISMRRLRKIRSCSADQFKCFFFFFYKKIRRLKGILNIRLSFSEILR